MPRERKKLIRNPRQEASGAQAVRARLEVLLAEAKELRRELEAASDRLSQGGADCLPEESNARVDQAATARKRR